MKSCCACGINTKTAKRRNVSFHQFPKDDISWQVWINAIGRKNYTPSKTTVLCSLHFAEDCLYYTLGGEQKQRRVVPGSVPTKFGFHTSNLTNEIQSNNNIENTLSCPKVIHCRTVQANKEQNSETEVTKISFRSKCATSLATFDHIQQEADMYLVDASAIPCEDHCTVHTTPTAIQSESEIHITEMSTISCEEQRTMSRIIQPEITVAMDPTHQKKCPEPQYKKLRRDNPQFVGDCEEDDFKDPQGGKRNWNVAMMEIRNLRKTVNSLQKSKRRLQVKVENLRSILSMLRERKIISSEVEKLLIGKLRFF